MVVKTLLRRNEYKDSVQLMQAASTAMGLDGVITASLMMGTPNNKKILEESGLLTSEVNEASPKDIIISVEAESEDVSDQAIQLAVETLDKTVQSSDGGSERQFVSTRGALEALPNANLVVISVPGEYAARESRLALEHGCNVFLFSDNVSVEEEVALKKLATEKGLLVMGPDCGTALVKGKGIGFANVVQQGKIGVVAASGTGLQEVTCLVHQRGQGISHGLGTGGRDVKDAVGGLSVLAGLEALEHDPATEIIIIVSKPPQKQTMEAILGKAQQLSKPVVVNFLGANPKDVEAFDLTPATTLEAAAYIACAWAEGSQETKRYQQWVFDASKATIKEMIEQTTSEIDPKRKYVRGLYAGGTFTSETVLVLSELLEGPIYTNVSGGVALEDLLTSQEHTVIDLGEDVFTLGKPHPMIDQTYRKERFHQEMNDPATAVILLDFVLGYGSHEDPVGDMIELVREARKAGIPVIAHVCGTDLDPQNYKQSVRLLEEANAIVMPTNAQAARLAALVATRGNLNLWRNES